jgi:hypothetical protein
VSLLSDRALAERLGRGAEASAAAWTISADDFARRVRALVEQVTPIS